MNCVGFRDDNTEFRTQWENLYLNWRTGVQLNTYFPQVFRERLIYVYWFKNLQVFEPGFECLLFIVMRSLLSFDRHIISLKSLTSQGKTTTENLKALNIRFIVVWDSTTMLMHDPETLNHTHELLHIISTHFEILDGSFEQPFFVFCILCCIFYSTLWNLLISEICSPLFDWKTFPSWHVHTILMPLLIKLYLYIGDFKTDYH